MVGEQWGLITNKHVIFPPFDALICKAFVIENVIDVKEP